MGGGEAALLTKESGAIREGLSRLKSFSNNQTDHPGNQICVFKCLWLLFCVMISLFLLGYSKYIIDSD